MAKKLWVGTDSGNEGDWKTAANWSPSGVPTNNDEVYLEDSSQDVTEGFDNSTIALTSLNIAQSFTGKIGDADEYLQIGTAKLNIGFNYTNVSQSGSGRIKIDLGATTACTVIIYNAGTTADDGKPPIRLKCANASTTIEVKKGVVGIGVEQDDTVTVGTIVVGFISNQASDSKVFTGTGLTLTTLHIYGGECLLRSAATTINGYGGVLTIEGAGAITTINARGATIYCSTSGTVTTIDIESGEVDLTKSGKARTVTTIKLDGSGKLRYDPGVVTVTNKVSSDMKVTLTAS